MIFYINNFSNDKDKDQQHLFSLYTCSSTKYKQVLDTGDRVVSRTDTLLALVRIKFKGLLYREAK